MSRSILLPALRVRDPGATAGDEAVPRRGPIRHAVLGTVATDGMIILITMLSGALVARGLLPAGRGAVAATLFWPQIMAGIGLLSVSEATVYRLGLHPDRSSAIVASSFLLSLCLAAATVLVGVLLLPYLLGTHRADLVSLARLYLLVFVPLNFAASSLLAADQGSLRFRRYNALRFLTPAAYLSAITVLYLTHRFSVGWVIAANCAAVCATAAQRIVLHRQSLRARATGRELWELLRVAMRFHPAALLLLLTAQADSFVVLMRWSNEIVGTYAVAQTLAATALTLISSAFYKAVFPHLSHVTDPHERVQLFARGVRYISLLLVIICAALLIALPLLLHALFGTAYDRAITVARLLVVVNVFVALKGGMIEMLRGLGEGRAGMIAAAISLAVFSLLVVPTADTIQLPGVAVALGCSNLAAVAFLVLHLHRRHALPLRELWGLNGRTVREVWAIGRRFHPTGEVEVGG